MIVFFSSLIWWLIFFCFCRSSRSSEFLFKIKIPVFLIIGGRLPAPFLPLNIELWMIYLFILSLYLTPSILPGLFHRRFVGQSWSLLSFFAIALFMSSMLFSFNNSYLNDGYGIILYSILVLILSLDSSVKRSKYANCVLAAFFMSILAVTFIAFFAQCVIFLGLVDCSAFYVYHPDGDIHCVPVLLGTIYRLSIGSNVNEYSFYLALALVLRLFCLEPFCIRKYFYATFGTRVFSWICNSKIIFLVCVTIAGTLALSRAFFLSIVLVACYRLLLFVASILLLNVAVPRRYFIVYLPFAVALIFAVCIAIALFPDIQYLLSSRFGFVVNPSLLLEGTSSGHRVDSLHDIATQLEYLSIFPILSVGNGTYLHNSFVQVLCEYGLVPAVVGVALILRYIFRSPQLSIIILVYFGSHHLFYNPLMWLLVWATSFHSEGCSPRSRFFLSLSR